ncbi:hypothetical protein TYRP_003931 [Tyrophagus putrescentiae]|nr:hypothetical protein TYRP_003931 [Tyrophagus putrescentiae]
MALKSELHYLHHPPHPHHHHHHLLLLLPNITSLTDDQLSISSTNYSVISPVNSVNSTTLPPLEVVLLRALLAQLLLGLAVNLALLASVVAANRSQSGPPYAHRQSLYASVASGAGRGAHLTAHRLTPVVDQILGLFAATAILRLLARAGLQVFCFYYGACTFFTPLPCSSLHGLLNTFLHTLHLWSVALLLQDRYIAHQDPSSYLCKCSHTVLYVTLIGVGFLSTMHYLAPIYGFSAYRFVTDEHTCTIDWLARYSCPYWVYSLLLLRGPALGAIACWTVLLTCQKLTGNSSRENGNVSPKQPSNSYSSYHRPSSAPALAMNFDQKRTRSIRESNGGGVVGISNSSYVLSSHTSSSSAALLSHHSRSNVLTPSREIASITTACWLFLVATVPKLIDSGCQACLAPSPYPVITDEAPSPPLVHATVAKRGADFELFSKENSFFEPSFFFSFLDETTSCVLLPLLLLACHSRLRFSLILIIACLLSCCRGLSCRGHRGQSGQRRPRKWCWSFGQSSSTAAAAARSSRSSSLRTSRTGGVGVNSTLSSQRYPSHHPFHHHLPTFHLSASSSAASSRQASIFPPPPPVFDESNLSAEFSGAGGSFLRINYPANSGSAAVASGERSLAVTIM